MPRRPSSPHPRYARNDPATAPHSHTHVQPHAHTHGSHRAQAATTPAELAHTSPPGFVPGASPSDSQDGYEYYEPTGGEDEAGSEEEAEDQDLDLDHGDGMDEQDAVSETSSAEYEYAANPEEFRVRQDELAGVREMSVAEEWVNRNGVPYVFGTRMREPKPIGIPALKAYVTHYLDETDWKYQAGAHGVPIPTPHPIRAVGMEWAGAEIDMLHELGLDDGLPAATEPVAVGVSGLPESSLRQAVDLGITGLTR